MTVGYADSIVQSEMGLFFHGACPKNIHFDVHKISIDSLPFNKDDLSKWLIGHWRSKEQKLKEFYSESTVERRHFKIEDAAQMFEVGKYYDIRFILTQS